MGVNANKVRVKKKGKLYENGVLSAYLDLLWSELDTFLSQQPQAH
jgi:hypothetical protein